MPTFFPTAPLLGILFEVLRIDKTPPLCDTYQYLVWTTNKTACTITSDNLKGIYPPSNLALHIGITDQEKNVNKIVSYQCPSSNTQAETIIYTYELEEVDYQTMQQDIEHDNICVWYYTRYITHGLF